MKPASCEVGGFYAPKAYHREAVKVQIHFLFVRTKHATVKGQCRTSKFLDRRSHPWQEPEKTQFVWAFSLTLFHLQQRLFSLSLHSPSLTCEHVLARELGIQDEAVSVRVAGRNSS